MFPLTTYQRRIVRNLYRLDKFPLVHRVKIRLTTTRAVILFTIKHIACYISSFDKINICNTYLPGVDDFWYRHSANLHASFNSFCPINKVKHCTSYRSRWNIDIGIFEDLSGRLIAYRITYCRCPAIIFVGSKLFQTVCWKCHECSSERNLTLRAKIHWFAQAANREGLNQESSTFGMQLWCSTT